MGFKSSCIMSPFVCVRVHFQRPCTDNSLKAGVILQGSCTISFLLSVISAFILFIHLMCFLLIFPGLSTSQTHRGDTQPLIHSSSFTQKEEKKTSLFAVLKCLSPSVCVHAWIFWKSNLKHDISLTSCWRRDYINIWPIVVLKYSCQTECSPPLSCSLQLMNGNGKLSMRIDDSRA